MMLGDLIRIAGTAAGMHLIYMPLSWIARRYLEPDWQANLLAFPVAVAVAFLLAGIGYDDWGTARFLIPPAGIFLFSVLFFLTDRFNRD